MPMKVLLLASSLLLVTAKECTKARHTKQTANLPSCVQQKIDSIKKQPKWNPPAEVNEYTYQGKTVYLFSAPCCDQYTTLYDIDCNYLCAPGGGFTGKGDGKCADFNTAATHVRLVWKDGR